MECGFAGNADIFGIGIRVGYYTQALAVWYANFFHFREAQVLRDVNKLFLFALVIVGLIYVHDARATYAVEAFLLLQIGMVIGLISIMDSTRYRSRYLRASNEHLISRFAIMGAGLIFNVCFWWRGLDVMQKTPCQEPTPTAPHKMPTYAAEHATYVCFFVKASMFGWLRTLMRVMTIYMLVSSALTIGYRDGVRLLQTSRRTRSKETFKEAAAVYQKIKRRHDDAEYRGNGSIQRASPSIESRSEREAAQRCHRHDGTSCGNNAIGASDRER